MRIEYDLLIHTNCLSGPIDKTGHIHKLRVRGDKNIRLLLCKGPDPKAMNEEYTLLIGATEPNRSLVPKGASQTAMRYREHVINDLRNRRCLHDALAEAIERTIS